MFNFVGTNYFTQIGEFPTWKTKMLKIIKFGDQQPKWVFDKLAKNEAHKDRC